MLSTVLTIHGLLRYAVLLAGVAAAVVALIGWRRRAAAAGAGPDRVALTVFAGLLDVQVLVGVVLLFLRGFYGQLMGHIVMMVLAVAAAHVGNVRARRVAPADGARIRFIAAVLALVFVVGGILAIQRPII